MAEGPNLTLPRRCACGAHLRWESHVTPWSTHWLALCASSTCGRITLPPGADPTEDGLEAFLLGHRKPQPYAPPWLRVFLQAACVPTLEAWKVDHDPCWACDAEQVMRLDLLPLQNPFQAVLCIRCGAVLTRHMSALAQYTQLVGGADWANPDPAIEALRQAIRMHPGETST